MSKKKIGKLGRNARSRGVPEGALRKPIITDTRRWFAELDAIVGGEPFMEKGREQPRTPSARKRFCYATKSGSLKTAAT